MCGFVFTYAKTRAALPSASDIERMADTIRHRGPDEYGMLCEFPVAMAHHRLSIIDIAGGKQPMWSPDRQAGIVFNGEIYNYRDIRRDLHAAGRMIAGTSDTEVLLAAYLEWGVDCLERLNGMFAFVIFDRRDDSVFAARDRFGEKPLYLTETPATITFASELKALLRDGSTGRRIDRDALYSYFTLGYIVGPRTIFRDICQLGPGTAVRFAAGVRRSWRYWQPTFPRAPIEDRAAALAPLRQLLVQAVQSRMVADVPVGFFLSGGLDSSLVVALASEVAGARIETFSIGFEEARFDERDYARQVAMRFNTRHHEFVLKPQSLDIIGKLAWNLDQPFADAAALPTWFLSELTREHVKVALSGDGGDEIFAGYEVYRGHILSERLRRLPPAARRAAVWALRSLPAAGSDMRSRIDRLARNIADADLSAAERFVAKQQTVFRRDALADAAPALAGLATGQSDALLFPSLFDGVTDGLAAIADWHQTVLLADDMLVKVDRTSMAHSLEVRAPLLDHRLAEHMNRVSFVLKLAGGQTKALLKLFLEQLFPRGFVRRRKQGFVVPLNHWFRDELYDYLTDRLLAPTAAIGGLIRREAIERLLGEQRRLERDRSSTLWAMLMFEEWCRAYGVGAEMLHDA
jgi:asparagine synthase (glutamine-hydrolysing)